MNRLAVNTIFESKQLSQDLAGKSVHGGMSTLAAQVAQSILQLVRAVILARLLTPNDFGLIGMVLVVTNFAQLFRDAGISIATVQKSEINHDQISTLFWVIVIISCILAGMLVLMAPLVAMFYGRQELVSITAVLSISLLVGGLAIQHQALMRRHMRFGSLAVIQVGSAAASLVVTILLAVYGWQYWALVMGLLVRVGSMTVMTFYYCPWIPGGLRRGTGVRSMLKFGGHVTGANFVNYLSVNADNLLIGRFLGAGALGLYAKAYQLFMLPITQIKAPLTQLAMPVLSSLQEQPERYRKYYQTILRTLAVSTMPLACYCIVEAEIIIRILLGPQWLEAVSVFRILAFAGVLWPVVGTWGLVVLSCGFAKRYFYWAVCNGMIMLVAIAWGLPSGISGVALGIVVATYLTWLPCLYYCFHRTPVTVALFLRAISGPLLASCLAVAAAVTIQQRMAPHTLGPVIVRSGVFMIVYTVTVFCQGTIRRDLATLGRIVAGMRKARSVSLKASL